MPLRDDDPEASVGFEVFNGTDLNGTASWYARSCIVDNNTSSFLKVVPAGRYVPPGSGAAFSFPPTRQLRATWTAPPGKTQSPAITAEAAQVVFYRAPAAPGSGIAIPVGISAGTAFASAARAAGTYTFNVPAQTGFRGIIVWTSVTAGAGTAQPSIFNRDPITGANPAYLTGAAIGVGVSSVIRVAPGIQTAANLALPDVIGQNPQIQVVVGVGGCTFACTYNLVP